MDINFLVLKLSSLPVISIKWNWLCIIIICFYMNPLTVLPNLCFVYVYCVSLLVTLEAWICWHGTNRDSSVYADKKVSFLGRKKFWCDLSKSTSFVDTLKRALGEEKDSGVDKCVNDSVPSTKKHKLMIIISGLAINLL